MIYRYMLMYSGLTAIIILVSLKKHIENSGKVIFSQWNTCFAEEMTTAWSSECNILERWLATESSYTDIGSN